MVRIGVVGDYEPANENHRATTAALLHSGCAEGVEVDANWVATSDIHSCEEIASAGFDGLLIAPGSPYRSMHGALAAITYCRTAKVPLLGTCGGFQHVVLEFARNVLAIRDAGHAEYDPYASKLFITALTCSLAGRQMAVNLGAGSTAAAAYRRTDVTERYYCNFGLDTSDYSFGYVANWAGGGDEAIAGIKASCERIQKTGATVLRPFEADEQEAVA